MGTSTGRLRDPVARHPGDQMMGRSPRLFRARSSKTIECRFTLKRVHDMIITVTLNSTLVKSAINH